MAFLRGLRRLIFFKKREEWEISLGKLDKVATKMKAFIPFYALFKKQKAAHKKYTVNIQVPMPI